MPETTPYTRRTRHVTSYEFACIAADWRRDGAEISDLVTYDAHGCVQRHVFAPSEGIHAIYTLIDTSQITLSFSGSPGGGGAPPQSTAGDISAPAHCQSSPKAGTLFRCPRRARQRCG